MVIDCHTHVFKQWNGVNNKARNESLDFGRIKNGERVLQVMPPAFEKSNCTIENLIANLDAHGVDKAVVFSNGGYGNTNDYLEECLERFPGRLAILDLVDIASGREAAEQLENHLSSGKFCGTKYEGLSAFELTEQMPLNDTKIMPVWETLDQYKGIGMFHISRAGDIEELEQVKRALPNLKMVIAHFGAETVFQHYDENWEKLKEFVKAHDGVWIETSSVSIYAGDQINFDRTLSIYQDAIHSVGAEKIMWGSDYPCMTLYATYYQILHLVLDGLKSICYDDIAKITGKNAEELFFKRS